MKIIKVLFVLILFTGGISLFYSCKHDHSHKGEASTEMTGIEYTSKYVCPMHCKGSGADEAGTCPVCGMDYVLNEDHTSDGHSHGEESEGHDHDGEDHDDHSHEDGEDHDHNH